MFALSTCLLASLLSSSPPAPVPEPEPQLEPELDTGDAIAVEESGDYVIVEATPASAFDEPAPRPVEFRAGAMLMTRADFTRTRSVDGTAALTTTVPTRIRARLEARVDRLRLLGEVQDARNLGDPLGPARSGFHQLLGEWVGPVPRGQLRFVAGRQEFVHGSLHLFAIAPWGAGMRSWDAIKLSFEGDRGGVEVFAGSLAEPLLSASVPLVEHVRAPINLAWVVDGRYEIHDALEIVGLVWGSYRKTAADTRSIVTTGVQLRGELAPGLRYDSEGHLQVGTIDRLDLRQRHLAGHAWATLDYLARKPLGPIRARPGAFLSFDFASGSRCTTTEYTGLAPCTEGVNRDFDAPWMAAHRWFGWADRFNAHNVIDGSFGVRVRTTPRIPGASGRDVLALDLVAVNHVFAFPEPGGRWHDSVGGRIGVLLDNRDPWAADEVDLNARLRYGWLNVNLGWSLVANLSGGRALSGESLRQFVYLQLVIDLWTA